MTETMTNIKDGHYMLGKAYLNNKQYAEAITHFQTVLDIDADFIDAHCGLCRAYLAQNDYENAETAVLTARQLAPNAPEVLSLCDALKETYYHKGITCYNEERYREAADCFQKTMTFDATYIAAYHAQALAYFGLHELAEAKKAAQAALQIDPNYAPVLSFLKTIEPSLSELEPANTPPVVADETDAPLPSYERENPSQASQEIDTEVSLDKEMQRALVFLNNRQYLQAEAGLKKIIQANPNDVAPHYHLAQTYMEIEAFSDAQRHLDIALRMHPTYAPALQLQNAITLLKKRENNRQRNKKIRKILLPVAVLAITGVIAFRAGVFSSFLPQKIPPKLSIEMTLEDPKNKNGIIDAGENVRLKLIITNAGSAAKNLSVRMLPKTIGGLRYQLPKTTFSVRKNGFQIRRIPITADKQVRTRNVNIKIQVLEINEILATRDFQLQIKGK